MAPHQLPANKCQALNLTRALALAPQPPTRARPVNRNALGHGGGGELDRALAGAAALPLIGVSAFSLAQSKLTGLPRIALVIGNTRYQEAPLKNPVNNAKAIAGELQLAK